MADEEGSAASSSRCCCAAWGCPPPPSPPPPLDPDGKLLRLRLLSCHRPHMTSFWVATVQHFLSVFGESLRCARAALVVF